MSAAQQPNPAGAQLEPGRAHALANLVEYVPGSVVSRTLQKNAGGTLTVFAMAQDQEISEHTTPFLAHVLGIEGELQLTIGGRPVSLGGGQIVAMPPHVPHALKAVSDSKFALIMIRD